jgi:predicted dehydrogenase
MRVAFVGSGLQTRRRAPIVQQSKNDTLVAIAGTDQVSCEALAAQFGCESGADWRSTIERDDIDAVVVTTPPYVHAEISIAALEAGKHVLCEKPLSRTIDEAEAMLAAAARAQRVLKCGFNHRHHPAVLEARRRFELGDFGRPITGRCRYGICGRPGYEREWRADPARAAGGQYAEQGVHAIDLFRWFMGDLAEVSCMTAIGYFTEQPLEDNGIAIFRSTAGALAMLHTSLTQWENLFSFEILGDEGYFSVEGLGATYGTETLSLGKRDFTAPFQDHVIQYRGGDSSWQAEWTEFTSAIAEGREPIGNGRDGLEAVRIALASYHAEATRSVVDLRQFGARS